MSPTPTRVVDQRGLYSLLPEIYRERDVAAGFALYDLMDAIADQVGVVENDIEQLLDNWFVETCEPWVLPYLGALVGYEPVHQFGEPYTRPTAEGERLARVLVPRREVADAIGLRQRKGTARGLEEVVTAATGWLARCVETFELVTSTPTATSPGRGTTLDVRDRAALARLSRTRLAPFDRVGHTVGPHRASGGFDLTDIVLFVWRLEVYELAGSPAHSVGSDGTEFSFDVLGADTQLFNRPQPRDDSSSHAAEHELPIPLERALIRDRMHEYYGSGRAFELFEGDTWESASPIAADRIRCTDLSSAGAALPPRSAPVAGLGVACVDPERGRIRFADAPERRVWVRYHYSFSADIGGGSYARSRPTVAPVALRAGELASELATVASHQSVEIVDSDRCAARLDITLSANQLHELRAADGERPVIGEPAPGAPGLRIDGNGAREFVLDGLLVIGGIELVGKITRFVIRDCTLRPRAGDDGSTAALRIIGDVRKVEIERSIVQGIEADQRAFLVEGEETVEEVLFERDAAGHQVLVDIDEQSVELELVELERRGPGMVIEADTSIIDGSKLAPARALDAEDSAVSVSLRRCTILGDVWGVDRVEALDSIIDGELETRANDAGVEPQSTYTRESGLPDPVFVSRRLGDPGYCRLADDCPEEVATGAGDRSEMGVFHDLFTPQRKHLLERRREESTPLAMRSSIVYVN